MVEARRPSGELGLRAAQVMVEVLGHTPGPVHAVGRLAEAVAALDALSPPGADHYAILLVASLAAATDVVLVTATDVPSTTSVTATDVPSVRAAVKELDILQRLADHLEPTWLRIGGEFQSAWRYADRHLLANRRST